MHNANTGAAAAVVKAAAEEVAKAKGGAGGTHIQKVEIVVSSNADPSRVARQVLGVVQNLQRNPGVSHDATNYSTVP
jgi:hypothetical protein